MTQQENGFLAMQLYGLITGRPEGIYGEVQTEQLSDTNWCAYHSEGYRIDVWKKKGFCYFSSDLFEGFKSCNVNTMIWLIRSSYL